MSGKAILVTLVLVVALAVGLGLALVNFISEGHSVAMSRPARVKRRVVEKAAELEEKKTGAKDLREFLKLVALTEWFRTEGRDFQGRAGAWQDAVRLPTADYVALVETPEATEVTISYLLWDKGSQRAGKVGERLLAAGALAPDVPTARNVYRALTASGHPDAAEFAVVLESVLPAGAPIKPARPEDCRLWTELSASR